MPSGGTFVTTIVTTIVMAGDKAGGQYGDRRHVSTESGNMAPVPSFLAGSETEYGADTYTEIALLGLAEVGQV
jgi:hypothetical protein